MSNQIDGLQFRAMILQAASAMEQHREMANELNVFPVPDGDTGTNMSMTMASAREALEGLENPTLAQAAQTAASAMLRGARGNSGVILSLLFRGIAKKLKETQQASGAELAVALREGVDTAYKAVMKPAEGTILTVSRSAAQKAVERCQEDGQLSAEEILQVWIAEGEETLTQTQFQNPVLKKAGVVDAGGYGLVAIFRGMADGLAGRISPAAATTSPQTTNIIPESEEEIPFAYCTEFIAQRPDASHSPDRLRHVLSQLGDSLVVVEDGDIVKVHVHTNQPDQALAEGLRFGSLLTVKVENMRQQHSAKVIEQGKTPKREIAEPKQDFGFVAVAAGDGIEALFRDDLGVDQIVSGGQSMNPSTSDILQAIDAVPAHTVYVLPNNKNIWMAAQQAAALTEGKQAIILQTDSIPQGISALLSYDPDATQEQNTQAMTEAIGRVHAGAITYAARNSVFDGKKIREGEFLVLKEGKLCANTKRLSEAFKRLAKELVRGEDVSYMTILYGQGMTESDAHLLEEAFLRENPQMESTILRGGQPVYHFLVSVE